MPAEAGISVTGRSTVLRVNYRNPAEIARTALELVSGQDWNDLDEADETGVRDVTTSRAGGVVQYENVRTAADLRDAVVRQVWSLLEAGHPAAGIAVLCSTAAEVRAYVELLGRHHLPVLPLERYAGQSVQAVKVGTVKRAKGLEFADVIHPVTSLGPRRLPADAPGSDTASAAEEQRILDARTHYVAMTRARDTVWLGSIA